MDEKQTTEEEEPKDTAGDIDEGDKPETASIVDDANSAAERLEKANTEKKKLLDREEALMAKKALGGRSEAGALLPEKKEETPQEYKDKILKGEQ